MTTISPPSTKDTRIILSLAKQNPDYFLWYYNKTKGWIHKHIVETDSISTYFASQKTESETKRIVLSQLSDIIVINSHSVGQSTYRGFSTGSRYLRNYYSMGHSTSRMVGDIMF